MNTRIQLVFLLAILVNVCSSAFITARNVSYTQNDKTTSFTFEAAGTAVDNTHNLVGNSDLIAFLISKNVLTYEHYAAAVNFNPKSVGNYTDAVLANFAFLLKFYALIEYQEVNGLPGFQKVGLNINNGTSDVVLSTYYNDTVGPEVQWFIHLDQNATTKVYTLTIGTVDGVFNYTVTYAGRVFNTAEATIDANSFKIGFNINYYKFPGASNNTQSQVALVLLAGAEKSATKSFSFNETDVSGLRVHAGSYTGFINFEDSADTWNLSGVYNRSHITFGYVDNYQASVGIVDWTAAAFFLSYDAIRPLNISYDPEIGADLPPISNSTAATTGSQVNPSSSSTGSQITPSTSTTGSQVNPSTSSTGSQSTPLTTGSISGSTTGFQVNPASTTGSLFSPTTSSGSLNMPNMVLTTLIFAFLALVFKY